MLDILSVTRSPSAGGAVSRSSTADASDFFAQMVAESAASDGKDNARDTTESRRSEPRLKDRADGPDARSSQNRDADRTVDSDRSRSRATDSRSTDARPTDTRADDADAEAPVIGSDAAEAGKTDALDSGDAQDNAKQESASQKTAADGKLATDTATDTAAENANEDSADPTDPAVSAAAILASLAQTAPAALAAGGTAATAPAVPPAGSTAAASLQANILAQIQQTLSGKTGPAAGSQSPFLTSDDQSLDGPDQDSALLQRLIQGQQKQGLLSQIADQDLDLSLTVQRGGLDSLPQNKVGGDALFLALAQGNSDGAPADLSQLLASGAAKAKLDGTALAGPLAGLVGPGDPTTSPAATKTGDAPLTLQAVLPGEITSSRGVNAATQAAKPAAGLVPPAVDQVAAQINRALSGGKDRITLQLNPSELGRVDIKLDLGTDGSVKAVVSVDRPDTLDLLQRDLRGLEKALQDAGLKPDSGSLSFSLKGEGQNSQGQDTSHNTSGQADCSAEEDIRSSNLDDPRPAAANPSDWHEGVVSIAV